MTGKKTVHRRVLQVIFLGLLLLLAACGQKALTYEEQINLGQRFLEDGDYEQAIVAFTAAIKIEPKLPPAYVGLADAHKGLGQPEEAVATIRQGVEAIGDVSSSGDLIAWAETFGDEAFASGDYDIAILAYDTLVFADPRSEYFQKLAEAYVAMGDIDSAMEVLRRGYEYTGDEALAAQLDALEGDEYLGVYIGTYTVMGTIPGSDSFSRGYESHYESTWTGDSSPDDMILRVGVRFAEPIVLPSGETISSAVYGHESNEPELFGEYLFLEWDINPNIADHTFMMTGRLYFDENLDEIMPSELTGGSLDYEIVPIYTYNPWGQYRFEIISVE
jgi:tetratricopeptide (TPR) repeat protein